MKKIKWIGLAVIISVIPILIAAQGDDKGAGPPKKEEAKPPVKAPPKAASPNKPAQPSKPGPYAYLVVRTDLDVVLDVNGEKKYEVTMSDGLYSIPLGTGDNYVEIKPKDGGIDGFLKTFTPKERDQRLLFQIDLGARRIQAEEERQRKLEQEQLATEARKKQEEKLVKERLAAEARKKEEEEMEMEWLAAEARKEQEAELEKIRKQANMVKVEGGWFDMGDTFGDGRKNEKPVHRVRVSTFLMDKHELTFREFDAFCDATGRSKLDDQGWGRENRPVIGVWWHDALEYCNWSSRQEGFREVYTISGSNVTADWSANGYRLPTEAEWEYAARGGQSSKGYKYAGSNNADEVGWYSFNSGSKTQPVGEKKPNELGLYDMSGNAWEYCWDWKAPYAKSSNEDPRGPLSEITRSGTYVFRVLRGGAWPHESTRLRSANRDGGRNHINLSDNTFGFRLARTP